MKVEIPWLRSVILTVASLFAASQATAQGPPRRPDESRTHSIEELRERLRQRPAGERTRLERNLEQFERLPREARAKLLQRARALRERERSLEGSDVESHSGEHEQGHEDDAAGREHREARLHQRMREAGRELRARLPEGVRKRLEGASHEQRRRLLEHLLQERRRRGQAGLDRLEGRLGLDPNERRRLQRLPLDQRLEALRKPGIGARRGPWRR